jgi:hypothetical protein
VKNKFTISKAMGLPEQAGVRVPAEAISFCTLVNDLIEYKSQTNGSVDFIGQVAQGE